MKGYVLTALAVLSLGIASAQNTAGASRRARTRAVPEAVPTARSTRTASAVQPVTESVAVTDNAAVPVTTVVPVQDNPVPVIDSTVIVENMRKARRDEQARRRAERAERFAATVDSLVRSRNFVFYPASMEEMPDGSLSTIYADYYCLGFFGDTAEVHLPEVNGAMQVVSMLNFDSDVSDYRLLQFESGLTSTFTLRDGDNLCFGRFVFSTVTGETVLTLVTSDATMRYYGWLSRDTRRNGDELKAELR